jgi:hypothetical protein
VAFEGVQNINTREPARIIEAQAHDRIAVAEKPVIACLVSEA